MALYPIEDMNLRDVPSVVMGGGRETIDRRSLTIADDQLYRRLLFRRSLHPPLDRDPNPP
jgi:hypothetical protein